MLGVPLFLAAVPAQVARHVVHEEASSRLLDIQRHVEEETQSRRTHGVHREGGSLALPVRLLVDRQLVVLQHRTCELPRVAAGEGRHGGDAARCLSDDREMIVIPRQNFVSDSATRGPELRHSVGFWRRAPDSGSRKPYSHMWSLAWQRIFFSVLRGGVLHAREANGFSTRTWPPRASCFRTTRSANRMKSSSSVCRYASLRRAASDLRFRF